MIYQRTHLYTNTFRLKLFSIYMNLNVLILQELRIGLTHMRDHDSNFLVMQKRTNDIQIETQMNFMAVGGHCNQCQRRREDAIR